MRLRSLQYAANWEPPAFVEFFDNVSDSLGDFLETWGVEQAKLPESERENIDGVGDYLTYRQAELVRLRDTFPEAWVYFNRPEFKQNLASSISVL